MSDHGLLVSARLRQVRPGSEAGMGLVELVIALTVLIIGIGATMSVFAGSLLSMQHAAKEGTAITVADRQMETYRSMPYQCISSAFTVPTGCITYTGFPNPYSASQTTSTTDSPDHKQYDVTTTINPVAGSSLQIQVSVALHGTSQVLAQETSDFSSAGQTANG